MEHAPEEAGLAAQEVVAGGTGFGRAGGAGIDGLAGGHRLPMVVSFVCRAFHRRGGDVVVFLLARGGNGGTAPPIWMGHLPACFPDSLLDWDCHVHYSCRFLFF